ncbi:MAG: DUF1624 domain-containing protein [Rhodobacteraceae bacterium]|jgi:uncharacterized membrane protein|nr:DUF1624 domain-containing protein [Paracoccaceae bacterium]
MVSAAPPGTSRIVALDVARTAALVGMGVFHFTWDLEFFGYVTPGTTLQGGWAIFARLVASSFLFLVGVSLVLAHGNGIRWPGFLRRLAMIAGAAALITAATAYAVPHAFIFFGMLHSIAVASVLGLAFLRAPLWLILAAALAVWSLPDLAGSPAFDTRWLAWTGLAATPPASFDFVPVTPWFAATLLGIAVARLAEDTGLWTRLRAQEPGPFLRAAAWPGRHSLAVYLLHQPVLLGLLWLFSRATG